MRAVAQNLHLHNKSSERKWLFLKISIWNWFIDKSYRRVFPLNFWWGGLKIFGPRRRPTGTKSDGGTCEKNPTEAITAHLMQNLVIFCYFKHEIQLFKVLLSLKVKFDTKMYLIFSNFQGRTSDGGGTSLGPKTGTSVGWGDWQNFRWMGDPQSPLGKNLLPVKEGPKYLMCRT